MYKRGGFFGFPIVVEGRVGDGVCGFGTNILCGGSTSGPLFFLIRILLTFVCWATCLARPTSLRTTRNLQRPVARNFDPAPTVCFRTVSFYMYVGSKFRGVHLQAGHSFIHAVHYALLLLLLLYQR